MDKGIISFLKQNTVLTLAVCKNDVPYCANCFYSFHEESSCLVFKSKRETEHIRLALKNSKVAGSILPNSLDVRNIQGIQFSGTLTEQKADLLESLKINYYKKYPFAFAFSGEIWAIELEYIQMTCNTIGFGKRLSWTKSQMQPV